MALIVLALIVVPLVEIYVLLQVGHLIGPLPTLALLIADSLLGAWLVRREGARAWSALTAALTAGRIPAREVADGALVLFGGALLLTPGFATDVVGVLCLLPPTRALLRRALLAFVARRAAGGRVRRPPTLRVRAERVRSERMPSSSQDGPDGGSHPIIEGDPIGRSESPRP